MAMENMESVSQDTKIDLSNVDTKAMNTDAMDAALDGLDSLNAEETGPVMHEMISINEESKLNIKKDNPNDKITHSTTKGSRMQVETKVTAISAEPLPPGVLKDWTENWKISQSKILVDSATWETTVILPSKPEKPIIYKGKEVTFRMEHKLQIPEKVKFVQVQE